MGRRRTDPGPYEFDSRLSTLSLFFFFLLSLPSFHQCPYFLPVVPEALAICMSVRLSSSQNESSWSAVKERALKGVSAPSRMIALFRFSYRKTTTLVRPEGLSCSFFRVSRPLGSPDLACSFKCDANQVSKRMTTRSEFAAESYTLPRIQTRV